MANLNKVMLIGRLTRDPEGIADGKGAKFGFAVNNRKLNSDTQKWEDVPVFIDCEVWNRGESKQATRFLETVKKGQQVYLEGHVKMDQWEDKNGGGKRTALRVVVENFQYLEAKGEGGGNGGGGGGGNGGGRQSAPAAASRGRQQESYSGGSDEDIPF